MPENIEDPITWECSQCGECGTDDDDFYIQAGDAYCEYCFNDCFSTCDDCGSVVWTDDAHMAPRGGGFYCEDCFFERYFYCPECGETFSLEDAQGTSSYDNVCVHCYRGQCSGESVQHYDYAPMLAFYGSRKKGNPTFGVETEINTGSREWDDCTDAVKEHGPKNFFYFMEDGSLSNGFEIATMPFTLGWMHRNKEAWDGLFRLRNLGCTSYNAPECGTHVHVGKDTFRSRLHQLKFARFFYRNPEFTTEISRRSSARLDEWATLREENLPQILKNGYGGHKYRAVNVSSENTIEVRVFRGTLSPIGYFANVEMVHSVFQFTARHGLRDLTLDRYIPFVYNNKKAYPHFVGSMGSSLDQGEVA